MRKPSCLALLIVSLLGVFLALTILYFYGSSLPESQPTPYLAHLSSCPECPPSGQINIWTAPDRRGIAGQVQGGSEVAVLGTQEYNGVLHYHIRFGDIDGWVSYLMIQP